MTAIKAAALVAFFSIVSKILGLVKIMVLGNHLGATQDMDVYVAAFRIPDLIFNLLILGTLSVAFIPVFVEYLQKDKKEAFEAASTIFNLTLLVMAFFVALGFLFAKPLIGLLAPGFSSEAFSRTVSLTRILMLSPLLFSLSSVLTSILHSHKRFLLASIAPLFYNISIIFGVLVLYPDFGVKGLGFGVVMGALLHFLFQFPSVLRMGLRPLAILDLAHRGVKKIGKLFLPRIFALDLGQVSLLVATVIGSSLAVGSLSGFYYAYELETVPVGVFAMSFAIASFPTMAEFWSKKDFFGFQRFFSTTIVQVLFLIIPISILMLLLRAQIVRLIVGAGQGTLFTFEDTRLTAQALGFFVLSLFAQSLVPILARAFFALQNTLIPLLTGTISAVVNIILAVIFVKSFGAPGLALAFSIAAILNMLMLSVILRKKLDNLDEDFLLLHILKISVASIIMGIFAYLTLYIVAPFVNMQTYFGVLVQALSTFVVAVLVYLGTGILIRLPEARQTVSILKNWFNKFTGPVTSAIVDMFTDLR